MKICRVCEIEKDTSEYYSGHAQCKSCVCKKVRHRRAITDSVREYDRQRANQPHRLLLQAKITKRTRERNPEAYKARTAVSNAVRDKRLVKPSICSNCNQEKRLAGHHEDYSKPLDVIWLCYQCHARHHHAKDTK